jgi:hypothetical protein
MLEIDIKFSFWHGHADDRCHIPLKHQPRPLGAIHCADHAINTEAAVGLDGDFGNLGDERIKGLVHSNAATALFAGLAGFQWFVPISFAGGELQHAEMARVFVEPATLPSALTPALTRCR